MNYYSKQFRNQHLHRGKIQVIVNKFNEEINELAKARQPFLDELNCLNRVSFFVGKYPVNESAGGLTLLDKYGNRLRTIFYYSNGKTCFDYGDTRSQKTGWITTKIKYNESKARLIAIDLLVYGKYRNIQIKWAKRRKPIQPDFDPFETPF